MWKVIVAVGAISIVRLSQSGGIIQVAPTDDDEKYIEIIPEETEPASSEKPVWSKQASLFRRVYKDASQLPKRQNRRSGPDDNKETKMKKSISVLLETTMNDTDYKMKYVNSIKKKYKDNTKYKIGFIVGKVQKSREVLNDLFTVAVKHRDQWRALEELKILELIVQTNLDTTRLVRQLMEYHKKAKSSSEPSILRMNPYQSPEDFDFLNGVIYRKQPMTPVPPMLPGMKGPPQPEMPVPSSDMPVPHS